MAASREKILKAQLLWSDIQEKMSESEWEGFIKKYGNPLVPPVDEVRLDEFILGFSEIYLGKKNPEQIAAAIDKKQLRGFIDEYETGAKRISEIQAQADIRGKEYVQAQIKRNQEIVRHALEARVQANQKEATYKKLKEESEKQPNSPVEKIASTVVSKIEDATPFFQKEEDVADFVKEQSFFSKLKGRNIIQKAASPIADAVITVFPDLRQGVLNKNFEAELQKILKAPEALMDKLGIKAVDTDAFKLMARRVQTGLSQTSKPGGARTFIDDVTASVFHKSFTITAEQSVVTYWEVVRTSLMQDKPIPSANQFMASGMGMGSSLVHMGVNMGISEVKGAALRSIATKLGIGAIEGFSGPLGWAALALQLGGGLLGKVGGWLKGLTGVKSGEVPGDRWILGIGCGAILLVFFILPIVSQLNIDSSLVGRLSLGGGVEGGGPSVNCSQTPDDPQCKFTACVGDCKWPASGIITQGPNTGGYCSNMAQTSHGSGSAANGIDIANFGGGPIYTPRAGIVAEAFTDCGNNTGHVGDHCGGGLYSGYGNHVILKTDDGYTLIFGHMESAMNVRAGQHVDAGTQLGWMDQTGNSTGTHLHFGVLSGGSVLDFVPQGDTTHAPGLLTGCVDGESSCKKTCPYAPITAGK